MLLEILLKLFPYLFLFNLSWVPFQFPPLDLAHIFSPKTSFVSRAAEDQLITVLVTGDILPGRSVHLKFTQNGDPTFAFVKTAQTLREADITVINLEGPLISNCPVFYTGFTFCGDPRFTEGLQFAGVDVVNVANNHIYNFGSAGLAQTLETLDKSGLLAAGEGRIANVTVKGIRFAFLGFDAVGKILDRSFVSGEIEKARAEADVVVVQFHWGQEYTYVPKRAGSDPIELGHLAIESGADLVASNHPHWVQGIEFYHAKGAVRSGEDGPSQEKPIVYSHGNFVFDQTWSRETTEGMVGKYTFFGKKLVGIEFLPVKIDPPFQPRFLTGEEKEEMLRKIKLSSEQIRELLK